MDLKSIPLADAAPLMHDIEEALSHEQVEVVRLVNSDTQACFVTLSREQAERLLTQLETTFFAAAN